MPAKTIATKITDQQRIELDAYLAEYHPGMKIAEYIRFAIAQDMQNNDVQWSEEAFIDNKKRQGKPIPWKPEQKRWSKK